MSGQWEDKMKIFPGIIFLILVFTTPFTVLAADSSDGGSNEASSEQSDSTDNGQDSEAEEEEPDCD
ncbi:MAG: hypothetical protein ACN4GM_06650 [Gammaproteobacteria bacterium]